MRPELAVFGGSFDPPHVGHVFLATYALSVAGVARVLVAPTYEHAFGKPLGDFDHRLAMCGLAFAPLRSVEISPVERALGGVSRTLRLVDELARRYPDHDLRLLVGADILPDAPRWDRFDEIVARAPLLVAGRSGYEDVTGAAPLALPAVSSSQIRRDLEAGIGVEHVVPRAVHAYIAEHGLYRGARP